MVISQNEIFGYIKVVFIVLLSGVVASCGGGSDSNSVSFYTETVTTTSDGVAEASIDGVDVSVSSVDSSTLEPLESIDVTFEEINGGVLIWANDPTDRYFPYVQFIPDELGSIENSLNVTPRIARTTLVFGLLFALNYSTSVYEYLSDPPQFSDVMQIDGIPQRCVTGDLDDVLALIGAGGAVRGLKSVVDVLGAPARIRGVTAINLGFKNADLAKRTARDVWVENFKMATDFTSTNGFYCWRVNPQNNVLIMTADIAEIQSDPNASSSGDFNVTSRTQTGISVSAGDTVQITATGSISLGFLAGSSSPDGIEYGNSYNYYNNALHGQLIGLIGNNAFQIGSGVAFISEWSGNLELLVNDNDPSNNVGAYRVNVGVFDGG